AYDFKNGEPWERLIDMGRDVAKRLPDGTERKRPLTLETAGDWITEGSPKGRTLYVGSRQSSAFVRIYEKGKQLRGAHPDQAEKYSPGWVRVEFEVKPQKQAGWEFATRSPIEVWGAAAWSRQLHKAMFGGDLEPAPVTYERAPDDERAWRFMLKQYGPLLRRRYDLAREAMPDAKAEALWQQIGL